jgi:hypothetical protein
MPLFQQVNAVSRMRFELGRYTETHNGQSSRRIAHKTAIEGSNLQKQLNSFPFSRLQIEMQRQV